MIKINPLYLFNDILLVLPSLCYEDKDILFIIGRGKSNITFNNKAFCYVAVKFQQLKIKEGYNQMEGLWPTKVMPCGVALSTFLG
jgi:hypothetical protein